MKNTLLVLIFYAATILVFNHAVKAQSYCTLQDGLNQPVYSLAADSVNNLLFVGGQFTLAGNIQAKAVASYNLNNWDSLRNNMGGSATALCVYNNELYAGGGFSKFDTSIGTWQVFSSLIKWNKAATFIIIYKVILFFSTKI